MSEATPEMLKRAFGDNLSEEDVKLLAMRPMPDDFWPEMTVRAEHAVEDGSGMVALGFAVTQGSVVALGMEASHIAPYVKALREAVWQELELHRVGLPTNAPLQQSKRRGPGRPIG